MATPDWNPESLLRLSGSYWQTCTLHTGVKLGVFTLLGSGAKGAGQIAADVGADVRGMRILLNALSAMGLIEKMDDVYANTSSAGKFLDRNSPDYIGHMIMHHHHLMDTWGRMDEAVRTGAPIESMVNHGEDHRREAFLMGMYNIASQQAPHIAAEIDLSRRKRLLDLGGGPGTYAIHFCKQNPDLDAVIYDLETTEPFAEKTVEQHGLSHRISFAPGNYITEDLVGPYDVVWVSHILHSVGPDTCRNIIEKAVGVLEPEGMILVHDFFLADTMDGPLFPALFSLNMLQATSNGQSYAEKQIREMLEKSGVRDIKRLTYEGPTESGIIAGNIPG